MHNAGLSKKHFVHNIQNKSITYFNDKGIFSYPTTFQKKGSFKSTFPIENHWFIVLFYDHLHKLDCLVLDKG